jgi:hypothetical protein
MEEIRVLVLPSCCSLFCPSPLHAKRKSTIPTDKDTMKPSRPFSSQVGAVSRLLLLHLIAFLLLLSFGNPLLVTAKEEEEITGEVNRIDYMTDYQYLRGCAKWCFFDDGHRDHLAENLQCDADGDGAKNRCVCRQDLIPKGRSFLSSCAMGVCEQNTNDASSVVIIYGAYCAANGYRSPNTEPGVVQTTSAGRGNGGASATATAGSRPPAADSTSTKTGEGFAAGPRVARIAAGMLVALLVVVCLHHPVFPCFCYVYEC